MEVIKTNKAPKAIGPYSQAIKAGNMLFISGQLGIDPESGDLKNSIEEQAVQSFSNIGEILKAAGCGYNDVCKTTIFLTDLANFALVNSLYEQFFISNPARSCVEVSKLPKGALIECEVIALSK